MTNLNNFQKSLVGTLEEAINYFNLLRKNRRSTRTVARTLDSLVLTEKSKVTKTNDLFLLFDTRIVDSNRIICYATVDNLKMLLNSKSWLADATFAVRPFVFSQLWVIYANFKDKTLPAAFFLMTGKSKDLYVKSLTLFKLEIDKIDI